MHGISCSYTYNEGKERMDMPVITKEAYEHFERVIYNPLLIIVLEKDEIQCSTYLLSLGIYM